MVAPARAHAPIPTMDGEVATAHVIPTATPVVAIPAPTSVLNTAVRLDEVSKEREPIRIDIVDRLVCNSLSMRSHPTVTTNLNREPSATIESLDCRPDLMESLQKKDLQVKSLQ